MKETNKKIKKAQRDVELARRISSVMIKIDGKNFEVFLRKELLDPLMLGGRISVIGPSGSFDEVLLMEVAIGPSRPYNAGWIPSVNGHKRWWFRERKKIFEIAEEQYRMVAPSIFWFIQFFADKRVSNWKCNHDNLYSVKMTKKWWSHREKHMYHWEKTVKVKPATRFSVNAKDNFIVKDVFSAELDFNKTIRVQLGGLARFCDKRLKRDKDEYKRKKSFNKLKSAQDIQGAVDRLPSYHKIETLNHLPNGKENVFYRDLAQLFDWNEIDKSAERKIADSALSGTGERIGDLQLKIVSIQNNIVFEVEAKPLPAR